MLKRFTLAALLLWLAMLPLGAAVDDAVCTSADAGATCTGTELSNNATEEIGALSARAPMVFTSVTGTNTITACATPTKTALVNGMSGWLKPANDNTGATTFNLCSIGAVAVTDSGGNALASGNLLALNQYLIQYYSSGNQWRVLTPLGAGTAGVLGPASATDKAITRFDGTTGKVVQNSGVTIDDAGSIATAAGTTTSSPLTLQSGTLETAPDDGDFEVDANNFYGTTDADNRGYQPIIHYIRADATRTFTSNTTEQAIFNSPTNGRLTLETGAYRMECTISMGTMSATSGNASFDILGAGTATLAAVLYEANGVDGAVNTAAATSGSYNTAAQSPASVVTAGTGTALNFTTMGTFEVSVAGTIQPAMTLVTASAAVIAIGSYCSFERIGSTSSVSVGQWD